MNFTDSMWMSEEPQSVIIGTRVRDPQLLTSNLRELAPKLADNAVNVAIHVHPANDLAFSCERT